MSTQTPGNAGAADGTRAASKAQLWAGRIISGLVILFLLVDAVMKLFKPTVVVKSTRELGFPESEIVGIGVVLLICTLLYSLPRTARFGVVLLTGYLGGAIASQVRAEMPWFNVIFAFAMACLAWTGLWLRDIGVRKFLS